MRLPAMWKKFRDRTFGPSADIFNWRIGTLERSLDELRRRLEELAEQVHAVAQNVQVVHDGATEAVFSMMPVLTQQLGIRSSYLRNDLTFPIFNPGVAQARDEILFVSRSSNLRLYDDRRRFYEAPPHDTVNVFHRYDKNLRFIDTHMLDDQLLRANCKAAEYGIEDLRLFNWNGALWAMAAGISAHSPDSLSAAQILIRLDQYRVAEFFEFSSPTGAQMEKNWIPLVKEDKLFLLYSIDPMVVYEFADGALALVRGSPAEVKTFDIRGGTPLLPWGGYYIGLVHAPNRASNGRGHYTHNFIVLDDKFDVVEISRPFFLQRKGIEFACGIIQYGDDLLISYGVSDRRAAFCVLPADKIGQWVVGIGSLSKQPDRSVNVRRIGGGGAGEIRQK